MNAPNDETRTDSPFGRRVHGPALAVRVAVAVLVLGTATAAAYVATRSAQAEPSPMPQSGALTDTADALQVHLDGAAAKRIGVTYAAVSLTPLTRDVRTVGQVTVDERRVHAISPRIDGWIEELHVNFTGQFVRRGDPLFSIYSPSLVAAQQELLLARRLADALAADTSGAAASARDLLASARRRLQYWDVPDADVARIEASGEVQKRLTLRAPDDGFVVEKNVVVGQSVTAGDAAYRIADIGVVWVEGEVYEQDSPLVRLGDRVTVELEAFQGERISGVVAYVYPTMTAETRTIRIRVELPNPGFRLKPGMYATILLRASGSPVLTIPRSALLETGTRAVVFVKRPDGMLEPREVVRGTADADRVHILRGLSRGDTVVTSATFLIDAESNLKAALGGMGSMPGMDMKAPPAKSTAPPTHGGSGHEE
jgi:RND family efflux transporter MFP subunit